MLKLSNDFNQEATRNSILLVYGCGAWMHHHCPLEQQPLGQCEPTKTSKITILRQFFAQRPPEKVHGRLFQGQLNNDNEYL